MAWHNFFFYQVVLKMGASKCDAHDLHYCIHLRQCNIYKKDMTKRTEQLQQWGEGLESAPIPSVVSGLVCMFRLLLLYISAHLSSKDITACLIYLPIDILFFCSSYIVKAVTFC